MDINTKRIKKNAFRVTKERGLTAARVPHPRRRHGGGAARRDERIAEDAGNGTVHVTGRQGFEIPGIPFEKMAEVNAALQPIMEALHMDQETPGAGYPALRHAERLRLRRKPRLPLRLRHDGLRRRRSKGGSSEDDLHFKVALTAAERLHQVHMRRFASWA